MEDQLTRAILKKDKLVSTQSSHKNEEVAVLLLFLKNPQDWTPIMASVKADSRMEEIVELFLSFLETRIEHEQVLKPPEFPKYIAKMNNFRLSKKPQLPLLFDSENISKDTLFTLLMRNNELFRNSRRTLFQILVK